MMMPSSVCSASVLGQGAEPWGGGVDLVRLGATWVPTLGPDPSGPASPRLPQVPGVTAIPHGVALLLLVEGWGGVGRQAPEEHPAAPWLVGVGAGPAHTRDPELSAAAVLCPRSPLGALLLAEVDAIVLKLDALDGEDGLRELLWFWRMRPSSGSNILALSPPASGTSSRRPYPPGST